MFSISGNKKSNIAILVGSLRRDSYNLRLARKTKETIGERAAVDIIVPRIDLFSEDYEREETEPENAGGRDLRSRLRRADALLVCSPEYDRLPSAIILNACHWASRPPERPLVGTPVMLAGVSSGKHGTKNARPALRLAFERLGAHVLQKELFFASGKEGIDEANLSEEADVLISAAQKHKSGAKYF